MRGKGGVGVQSLSAPRPGFSKGAPEGLPEPSITQRVLECSSGMFLPPLSYLVPDTLTGPILQSQALAARASREPTLPLASPAHRKTKPKRTPPTTSSDPCPAQAENYL